MQIDPSKVIRFLEKKVKPFFKFELPGRSKFSEDKIFKILAQMSIQNSYAEATCNYQNGLSEAPSSDTFLRCIKKVDLKDITKGFYFFNKKAIKSAKRQSLFLTPVPIAIDWVDLMFYGDKNTEMIIGTQHKKGSNYAYRYMTASILRDQGRFVIAVVPFMQPDKEGLPKIIEEMLNEIKKEVKILHLLFDRGFYNIRLISLLKKLNIKFMIHTPCNEVIKRVLQKTKLPFLIEYKSEAHGDYPKDNFNILGLEWAEEKWFFATNINFDKKLQGVIEIFRKRWGIETSYRMVNQFLSKTTSKNYTIRMFYFFFACIMYNAWVLFNLLKSTIQKCLHIPVLFFKNLLLTLFLAQKNFG